MYLVSLISEVRIRKCLMLWISDIENSKLHLQSLKYASIIVHGCSTYGINSPERKMVMAQETVKNHSTNLVCYKFPKYLKLYILFQV